MAIDLSGVTKATKGLTKSLTNGKVNQKLLGAGIGAGTGAIAGAASNDENKGKGAVTGALLGAAGGALTGSLGQKNLETASKAARNKGFAAGLGTGTAGGVLGSMAARNPGVKNAAKSAGKAVKGFTTNIGGKAVDAGKAVSDAVSSVGKDGGLGAKISDGVGKFGEWYSKNKDTLSETANGFKNIFKESFEYRDMFGTAVLDKVASDGCTAGNAIAEILNIAMDKVAMQIISPDEYVEKVASEILDRFEERVSNIQ